MIRVFAPATIANLGPGFDILGMAVTQPGDIVSVRRIEEPITRITRVIGADLPLDPAQNTAGIAADYVRRQIDPRLGIELELEKGLPLASGLGSSAASAVAAAVAVNALLGNPLRPIELLPALLEAEAAVSGRHLDNVAPALLGGIVLVTGISANDVHILPPAKHIFNLHLAMVTPNVAVPTAIARAVLPTEIPFKTLVDQTKAVAQLMQALHTDDVELFAYAMLHDRIVEPAREHLIPHFKLAKEAALKSGALAAIISGAGPTMCIVAADQGSAHNIASIVCDIYETNGIRASSCIVQPSQRGAYVL